MGLFMSLFPRSSGIGLGFGIRARTEGTTESRPVIAFNVAEIPDCEFSQRLGLFTAPRI
jgi:hypothetical protein